jgi:hypothetical protein
VFFGKRRKRKDSEGPREFGGDDFGFEEPDDAASSRRDRSQVEPPSADRSRADRSRDDRSEVDRSGADRSRADRSRADRSRDDRSREDRSRREGSDADEDGPLGGRSVDDATFVSGARAPQSPPLMPSPARAEADEDLPDVTRVIGPPVDPRTTTVAWLVVASGPGRGRDYRIGERRTRVGTADECEIRLSGDPYVSTTHAEVGLEGGDVVVHDLGSTNGTYRNDDRIRDAVLEDGDRLRFGLSEFVFKSVRL